MTYPITYPFGEVTEGEKPFRLALGNLIVHYVGVERMVHMLFHMFSGIPQVIGQTIIGGMRFADVLNIVSKLVDLSSLTDEGKAEYVKCVEQINHISQFRHALIHRGGFSGPEDITSSNAITAKSPEAVEIWRFTVDDINAAARDAHALVLKLWLITSPSMAEANLLKELIDGIREPWRYKPVRPEKPNQPPRKAPR